MWPDTNGAPATPPLSNTTAMSQMTLDTITQLISSGATTNVLHTELPSRRERVDAGRGAVGGWYPFTARIRS
jgi:hypothetical protein